MLRERINVSDLESDHFAARLVERLGWAVSDAHEAEQHNPERLNGAPRRRTIARGLRRLPTSSPPPHRPRPRRPRRPRARPRAWPSRPPASGRARARWPRARTSPTTEAASMSSRESPAAMQSARRVAARLHVPRHRAGLRCRRPAPGGRHGRPAARHLLGVLADDAVVDQPQPVKPGGREHRMNLLQINRSRGTGARPRDRLDHGVWYSSRPANRSSSSAGAPEASIWS